jgi:hypothetical protein
VLGHALNAVERFLSVFLLIFPGLTLTSIPERSDFDDLMADTSPSSQPFRFPDGVHVEKIILGEKPVIKEP